MRNCETDHLETGALETAYLLNPHFSGLCPAKQRRYRRSSRSDILLPSCTGVYS